MKINGAKGALRCARCARKCSPFLGEKEGEKKTGEKLQGGGTAILQQVERYSSSIKSYRAKRKK